MQVALRRLIIVSAISLFGATGGVALGNFAAGGAGGSGTDELAAYMSMVDVSGDDAATASDDRAGFVARPGPSSYHCEGCDASPYKDRLDGMVADITPLPRYQVEDAPLPAVPREAAMAPARPVAPAVRPIAAADGAVGASGSDIARPIQAPPLPE